MTLTGPEDISAQAVSRQVTRFVALGNAVRIESANRYLAPWLESNHRHGEERKGEQSDDTAGFYL
jgi:hypothetical protein